MVLRSSHTGRLRSDQFYRTTWGNTHRSSRACEVCEAYFSAYSARRVGFACRYQKFQVPIGYNNFGYALSDVDGTVVNGGSKKPYAKPFGPGDVIGCYLSLGEPTGVIPDPRKDLKLLEHLQTGILCDPRDPPAMELNAGSYVEFSINGEKFGKCELKVWDGYYHPAAALYMGATVKFNFGPDFDFPPPDDFNPCQQMTLPEVL
ncbi:spry domain containing protein, putative [Babesia ovata]|uniref:Spry domain containing protein, putative n=1 Tax=Babesia ovata TaxID=189622 RepID=A0A2H6KHT1_9APIC|nr:spry domain containing protein, putative [Babesia ovata]GBE62545.1 spry domain containing protein, putative [Babesia ovata]